MWRGTSKNNNPSWNRIENIWNEGGINQFWRGKSGWATGYLINTDPNSVAENYVLCGKNVWKDISSLINLTTDFFNTYYLYKDRSTRKLYWRKLSKNYSMSNNPTHSEGGDGSVMFAATIRSGLITLFITWTGNGTGIIPSGCRPKMSFTGDNSHNILRFIISMDQNDDHKYNRGTRLVLHYDSGLVEVTGTSTEQGSCLITYPAASNAYALTFIE